MASIPTTPFDVIKTKLNTQACLNHPCEKRSVCESMSKKTQKFKPYNNVSSNVGNSPVQMLFTSTTTEIKYRNIVDTTATIYRE